MWGCQGNAKHRLRTLEDHLAGDLSATLTVTRVEAGNAANAENVCDDLSVSFHTRFQCDSNAEAWIKHGLNGGGKEDDNKKDKVGRKYDDIYHQDSNGHVH